MSLATEPGCDARSTQREERVRLRRRARRRDHQAGGDLEIFLRRRGAGARQRRDLRGRSSRHSRRERRRQVDADEHHLRIAAAGLGRNILRRSPDIRDVAADRGLARRRDRVPASRGARRPLRARKLPGRPARVAFRGRVRQGGGAQGVGRSGAARAPARARRHADGGAEASVGDRQGARDPAEGADPRRTNRRARSGRDRHVVRPHPRRREDGNGGHLHHPPAGGTAADRAKGHGAARRTGARRGARR